MHTHTRCCRQRGSYSFWTVQRQEPTGTGGPWHLALDMLSSLVGWHHLARGVAFPASPNSRCIGYSLPQPSPPSPYSWHMLGIPLLICLSVWPNLIGFILPYPQGLNHSLETWETFCIDVLDKRTTGLKWQMHKRQNEYVHCLILLLYIIPILFWSFEFVCSFSFLKHLSSLAWLSGVQKCQRGVPRCGSFYYFLCQTEVPLET